MIMIRSSDYFLVIGKGAEILHRLITSVPLEMGISNPIYYIIFSVWQS